MHHIPAAALGSLVALTLAVPARAQDDDYPKLGPDAVSLTEDHAWLQAHEAPDFWALSPFVKPQFTSSACSIASVTAALNGLNGLPAMASQTVMSQQDLLGITGLPDWAALSAEGGDGVTFDQLVAFATAATAAVGPAGATVSAWQPLTADDATLATTRDWLAANQVSADDVLLVYFNQGVVTGDWDGPHISVIGAHDAEADRVLVLEVDQDWYVPYWTPVPVLLEAMVRPTGAEHGPLEGQQGGLVRIGPPG